TASDSRAAAKALFHPLQFKPVSRRFPLVFVRLAVIVAVLVFCAPALAVTGGSLDGSAHPAVGILLADQGNGPQPACSGSLISPTVFLTAGHCTAGLASNRVWVSFDSQWMPSSALLQGTA